MYGKCKPTKEEFKAYLEVQKSGATNMFDVRRVEELSNYKVRAEHCMYIFEKDNYTDLCHEYNITMKDV